MKKKLVAILLAGISTTAYGQIAWTVANAASTGTTVNSLAKINSSAQAVIATTSDTAVPVYIVTAGAGTSGVATLASSGTANCTMDSNIASGGGGYFVIASTTTGGDCHAQSAAPSTGTCVVGQLISASTTSGSTALVAVSGNPACYYGIAGGSGTINAAAQYDIPYYSGSGTAATLSGAAVSGIPYISSAAPVAATNTNVGALIAIAQYNTVISAGTSAALTGVAPSATSGIPYISQGSASNPTFGTAVVAGGGTGDTSVTAYAPILGGTTSTGALQSAAAGTSGQVFVSQGSSTKPTYIDFPETLIIPAANCNNTTAGAGWSIGSGGTVTCRAGTNNLGGYITITDTSSTFAQFTVFIPADWDTSTDPYIKFQFAAASDTTSGHTVIPQIKVSCPTAGNGTVSDDATFSAAQSSGTVTFGGSAVANGYYNGSSVQIGSTQMTGCIAGGLMIVQVGRATDTATGNINFYGATMTFPRQIVVQAN